MGRLCGHLEVVVCLIEDLLHLDDVAQGEHSAQLDKLDEPRRGHLQRGLA